VNKTLLTWKLSQLSEIRNIHHDSEDRLSMQEERDINTAKLTKGQWSALEDK
jgi:hypothetical protein